MISVYGLDLLFPESPVDLAKKHSPAHELNYTRDSLFNSNLNIVCCYYENMNMTLITICYSCWLVRVCEPYCLAGFHVQKGTPPKKKGSCTLFQSYKCLTHTKIATVGNSIGDIHAGFNTVQSKSFPPQAEDPVWNLVLTNCN